MQRLKILVSAWGSTGDVLPPIAVGAALMQRQLDSPDVALRCEALKRRIEAEDRLQLAADLVESATCARIDVKEVA